MNHNSGETQTESSSESTVSRVCAYCNYMGNGAQFVRVCRCEWGWSHSRCALNWAWRQELRHPGRSARCRYCGRPFNVTLSKSHVITALEHFICGYRWFRNCAFTLCAITMSEVTLTTNGMLILVRIYGLEEAREMMLPNDPVVSVIFCQFITYIPIIVSFIPWEDCLLKFLRKCSKLPILGRAFPKEYSHATSRVLFPHVNMGTIVSGFLLPVYSTITGDLLFRSVQSGLQRILLGGVFFMVAKGILNMYVKQKLYTRQYNLHVADYTQDN